MGICHGLPLKGHVTAKRTADGRCALFRRHKGCVKAALCSTVRTPRNTWANRTLRTFPGQPFSRPAFQPLVSGKHGKALTVLRHIGSLGMGLSHCCETAMYVRGIPFPTLNCDMGKFSWFAMATDMNRRFPIGAPNPPLLRLLPHARHQRGGGGVPGRTTTPTFPAPHFLGSGSMLHWMARALSVLFGSILLPTTH